LLTDAVGYEAQVLLATMLLLNEGKGKDTYFQGKVEMGTEIVSDSDCLLDSAVFLILVRWSILFGGIKQPPHSAPSTVF
jgi:hypothetical protein